jgi:hypothetical protein
MENREKNLLRIINLSLEIIYSSTTLWPNRLIIFVSQIN